MLISQMQAQVVPYPQWRMRLPNKLAGNKSDRMVMPFSIIFYHSHAVLIGRMPMRC
jgi:hypothetical protein